jgi:serine protease Do
VVVGVDKNSDAAEKGLQRGDVITSINQESARDLTKALASLEKAKEVKRKSVLLLVSRGGDSRFIAITLK